MPDNEFLRQTLTFYRDQRQRILEQLRPVDLMIRQIEADLGETSDATIPPDLPLGLAAELNGERKSLTIPGKRPEIRGDEFFGMSQGDAARAYLNKLGHAVEMAELVDALNKGGCRVSGADPKHNLYIALIRNTKDFVKVPNGLIGLRAMYPGLKSSQAATGKPKAKARKGKRKAAKKRATKAVAKATPKSPESPPPAREKAPVKATVKEVMADGQLMAGEVIVQKVQEKIGENAKPFTIYGILNKPDFEKVGDQFRLRSAVKEEAQATSA